MFAGQRSWRCHNVHPLPTPLSTHLSLGYLITTHDPMFSFQAKISHRDKVVRLKPKAAFLPLFNLDEPMKAGELVLTTELTVTALDSTSPTNIQVLLPTGINRR